MRPGKNGGQLKTGNPGNAGGTGRPPNWLKEWCDDLLADAKTKKSVEDILKDPAHPAFAAMWKAVSERAHGKPTQPLQHGADESLASLIAAAFQGGATA